MNIYEVQEIVVRSFMSYNLFRLSRKINEWDLEGIDPESPLRLIVRFGVKVHNGGRSILKIYWNFQPSENDNIDFLNFLAVCSGLEFKTVKKWESLLLHTTIEPLT